LNDVFVAAARRTGIGGALMEEARVDRERSCRLALTADRAPYQPFGGTLG
jgi:hypothetical protein